MKPTRKALAAATLTVLACAAPAAALPRLNVWESDYRPVASTTVDVELTQEKSDPAPAKIIMALQGGTIDVAKVPGTVVGAAGAVVATGSASPFDGATATFSGQIGAADPALHVADGAACTGRTFHDAVWTLNLAARGQSMPLTLYVDRYTDMIGSKYELTACLPSPYVSEDQGGAPFGANVRDLFIHLTGVFRNPGSAAVFHWWGFVTPYTPGTSTPDPRVAVETRAIIPVPFTLGLRQKSAPKGFVRLTGTLAGTSMHFGGDRLDVYAGTSVDRMRLVGRTSQLSYNGVFVYTTKAPARATFYEVAFGPADVTSKPGGCGGYSPVAGGCVTATLSEIDSDVVRVKAQTKKG